MRPQLSKAVLAGAGLAMLLASEGAAAGPHFGDWVTPQKIDEIAGNDAELNTAAFENPGNFKIGNTPRGIIIGPGTYNVDASFSKDIHFKERYRITLRGDFYNFFNHANFNNPVISIPLRNAAGAFVGNTNYINSAKDPRRVQLGARFSF